MNTTLDCLPCLFRQTLDALRRVSDDAVFHERFLREAPRDICFLVKVKCAVVAARAGLPLGAQAIV